MKVHELMDHKASHLGTYVPNILELEEGESINYIVSTVDYLGHMYFAFENGKIAKVPLKSYETKTNRKSWLKLIRISHHCYV